KLSIDESYQYLILEGRVTFLQSIYHQERRRVKHEDFLEMLNGFAMNSNPILGQYYAHASINIAFYMLEEEFNKSKLLGRSKFHAENSWDAISRHYSYSPESVKTITYCALYYFF